MKRWAVGYINAYDNDLIVEIVKADDWIGAINAHSHAKDFDFSKSSLDAAKQDFFDSDAAIDVVEIPQ